MLKGLEEFNLIEKATLTKKDKTVFGSKYEEFVMKLYQSIQDAHGRYDNDMEGAMGKDSWDRENLKETSLRATRLRVVDGVEIEKVLPGGYASAFWRLKNTKAEPSLDEKVIVSLKVGRTAWKILPDKKGNPRNSVTIVGRDLIPYLEALKENFIPRDKMSDDVRDSFHQAAIAASVSPTDGKKIKEAEKKGVKLGQDELYKVYNPKTDMFEYNPHNLLAKEFMEILAERKAKEEEAKAKRKAKREAARASKKAAKEAAE